MAYSTDNPPSLIVCGGVGGVNPQVWSYSSADAGSDVDDDGYFTNAKELGMNVGDVVFVRDTDTQATTTHVVKAINSNGSADLGDGTAVGDATDTD